MKKIFYFFAMLIALGAVLTSCNGETEASALRSKKPVRINYSKPFIQSGLIKKPMQFLEFHNWRVGYVDQEVANKLSLEEGVWVKVNLGTYHSEVIHIQRIPQAEADILEAEYQSSLSEMVSK